jgi:hypothetical protein
MQIPLEMRKIQRRGQSWMSLHRFDNSQPLLTVDPCPAAAMYLADHQRRAFSRTSRCQGFRAVRLGTRVDILNSL